MQLKLKAGKLKEHISHPDEIENNKHFTGQTDADRRTRTLGLRPLEVRGLRQVVFIPQPQFFTSHRSIALSFQP
jgi:hypothetical protein